MRSTILLLILLVLAGTLTMGCLTVNAPEKVDVQADTGSSKWNKTANKYASHYAGDGRSRNESKHDDKKGDDE